MRPSEFEAIRPHLQEASDRIDAYLKEKQALEDEELDELASRYLAALPQDTPSEMEPHKAPETAPAKLPWASPLCATLIENCQPWRDLSALAAADLWDCGWIKEAEAIAEVLSGLPTGPIQDHQPKLMDEQLDRCRKGAERIRTILAACLAGSTPPADQANESEGNGGKSAAKKPRNRKHKADPKAADKRAERREQAKDDKRLSEAWAGGMGQYEKKADLARAKGILEKDVIKALDRHRKKCKRAGKKGASKMPQ